MWACGSRLQPLQRGAPKTSHVSGGADLLPDAVMLVKVVPPSPRYFKSGPVGSRRPCWPHEARTRGDDDGVVSSFALQAPEVPDAVKRPSKGCRDREWAEWARPFEFAALFCLNSLSPSRWAGIHVRYRVCQSVCACVSMCVCPRVRVCACVRRLLGVGSCFRPCPRRTEGRFCVRACKHAERRGVSDDATPRHEGGTLRRYAATPKAKTLSA